MDEQTTRRTRASIVARARYIEDLVERQAAQGLTQYVLLGAGLDTFAQRRPEIASRLTVFEVDQPGPQDWKRRRLNELGFGVPDWLRLVPVDFEAGESWRGPLIDAGFDADRPAVIACTGVSMYLSRAAIAATLRAVSGCAAGSTVVMTFMVPLDFLGAKERPQLEATLIAMRSIGTPFVSLISPPDMLELAHDVGLRDVRHVSPLNLAVRYFVGRRDGLLPSCAERLLVART